jgi:paraquat-inducible protein B
MARRANPTLIGAFVVGAVLLAIAGLVVIGGGKVFHQTRVWVAYFDESIKGLAVGAPVMFKGVKVGAVTDIKVVVDRKDATIRTPVFFAVDAERFTDATGGAFRFRKGAPGTTLLIERGLRAQLELQSLVTGQLAIQLDFHPDQPVRLVGVDPAYHEMPTIPSTAEHLAKTLEKLPIDQIAASALSAIEGVDRLVNGPDVKETLASLRAGIGGVQELVRRVGPTLDDALKDVRAVARKVDGQIGPLASGIDGALETSRETMRDVQALVRRVDGEVVPAARDTLQEARTLVRNVDGQVAPLVARTEKTLGALDAGIGGVREQVQRLGPRLDEALQDVQTAVRNLDAQIGPLASGADKTLEASRETVRDVQALVRRLDGEVMPAVRDTLQEARIVVRNVSGQVGPLVASIEKTLATAAAALEDARRVLATVDDTVTEASPLQHEVTVALRDLSAAARSIRALSDFVEMHPESLVFGKNSAGGR